MITHIQADIPDIIKQTARELIGYGIPFQFGNYGANQYYIVVETDHRQTLARIADRVREEYRTVQMETDPPCIP